mmetsp:Transcript_17808/g.41515  ORF Transcript_17808/g.41515 Transcript_17808/m.41515 type:complete len:219 (+) Transcript_17808:2088-2744(+)
MLDTACTLSSSTMEVVNPAMKCDCKGGMQPSRTLATMKITKSRPLDSQRCEMPLCKVVKMQYCSGASLRLPSCCRTSYKMRSTTSTGNLQVRVASAKRRNRLRSAHSHVMLLASLATISVTLRSAALSTGPRLETDAIALLTNSASSNASANIVEILENRLLCTSMRGLSSNRTRQHSGTASSSPRQCSQMLMSKIRNTRAVMTKPVQLSRLEIKTLP